jgi:AcrR family transcriptional regulator
MTARAARTTNAIREALHALLQEKPFSDISVQDIAERAKINRATFYAHFGDKFALLEDAARTRYLERLALYDPLSATDLGALIDSIALATFDFLSGQKHPNDNEREPQLECVLQDALYEFLLPALDDASALVVSSAVIGSTMQWRGGRYKHPSEELVQRLVTVLAGGVLAELQSRRLAKPVCLCASVKVNQAFILRERT